MFEYRKGNSDEEVAVLFGDHIRPTYDVYVEETNTGNLLAYVGDLGREDRGRVYLLRWSGRTIGLHATVTSHEGDLGTYPLFTLRDLGTSVFAVSKTGVARVNLTPDEAAAAGWVAAEACVAFESYREDYGPGTRVSDPKGSGRELSPADFGYPEIARVPRGVR